MGISNAHKKALLPETDPDGNPDGKGANGFRDDWRNTPPRGVVAKPQRQGLMSN